MAPDSKRTRQLAWTAAVFVVLVFTARLGRTDPPTPPAAVTGISEDAPTEDAPTGKDAAEPTAREAVASAVRRELDRHGVVESTLAGVLALDRMTLDPAGEHFVVELDDGRTAVLTIDPALQKAAEEVLARAQAPMGAIVVMDPAGRVLALAGRRNAQPAKPQAFELATTTWAPAASIFKIVTAAALIDAGVDANRQVCYHDGYRSVEASNLRDDRGRDTACNDLTFGLARSQNAIIAKLAHKFLDRKRLTRFARAFGFEAAPRFALACDRSRATIPDGELDFARVAAGFWNTELSALGGAIVANTVASGGLRVAPRLLASVHTDSGTELEVHSESSKRVISGEVARQVAKMMVETTASGTARKGFHDPRGRPFFPGVEVAGKTGSLTRSDNGFIEYSWFVGFAPADAPKVSIAVLLGNPARWHLKAHTAARLVLQHAL